MNIVEGIIKRYISLKHKYTHKNTSHKYKGSLKVLQNEVSVINDKIPLGTSAWENNRRNIRKSILEFDDISNFINWDVIQKTMFYEAPKVEYQEVIKNELLFRSIEESRIGNPKPYYLNQNSSGNLVHHAYSVSRLFNKCKLNYFSKIIEFGGGYGSMCRLFRNMNYSEEYIIFDLPEFLALQKFYLKSVNKKYINNTVFISDVNKLSNDNLNTLFIATWSLSEMPIDLREKLLEYVTFDYCLIAFQSEFDGINNVKYFNGFKNRYNDIDFDIIPIGHLKGHFYLIGARK